MSDRIDRFLAGLTPAELEEVRTKSLFLARRSATESHSSAEEVFDHVREFLLGRGIALPPYGVFIRTSKRAKLFQEEAERFRTLVTEQLKPRSKLERLAAYTLLSRIIERRLQVLTIPLSFNSYLTFLPKAAGLIELEFPGYRSAGLLPQVLLRRRKQA